MPSYYLLFIGDTWNRPVDHRDYCGTFESPDAAKAWAYDSVTHYGDHPQQAYIYQYDPATEDGFRLASVFRAKVLGHYPDQRRIERWWDVGAEGFDAP